MNCCVSTVFSREGRKQRKNKQKAGDVRLLTTKNKKGRNLGRI
jgi:hypothetical protein